MTQSNHSGLNSYFCSNRLTAILLGFALTTYAQGAQAKLRLAKRC